jgi:hypothetical protein
MAMIEFFIAMIPLILIYYNGNVNKKIIYAYHLFLSCLTICLFISSAIFLISVKVDKLLLQISLIALWAYTHL